MMAIAKGYTVIRILQTDVWSDKNDWQNRLLDSIKSYDTPQCIYLDNKMEYNKYKELMKTLSIDIERMNSKCGVNDQESANNDPDNDQHDAKNEESENDEDDVVHE